ncbi:AAA family ATPase [Streptomyces sp. 205]|uniref:AAA family ATPase n=1 Tax=Streptomyces coffeae TaxID=621382 RepID=A0ABS1NN30_9ACTN|nr:AAA family ATPase [Streptomyces coffeae]
MADTAKAPYRRGRLRWPLLEREAELAAADKALEELCAPTGETSRMRCGGLLAYAGAAGLGKTALLSTVRRRAAARGCTVLCASGSEQEQHLPFHVVRQLLQPVLSTFDGEPLENVLGGWYGIVGRALGLTADQPTQSTQDSWSPDPHGVRDGLDWAVTHVVVRRAPVLLALDDAHWADRESLDWLTAFAPRVAQLPILIVVTYRPEELTYERAAVSRLAERHGSRPHSLTPLTSDAVSLLVRDRLGADADDAFCRACWAITGGSPFETVELAAAVSDQGLEPRRENVPRMRDLISAVQSNGLIARMERLGAPTVRLAWAVAVLGTEASLALAAHVAGLSTQESRDAADRMRIARILAGDARDLAETGGSGMPTVHALQFLHPLIASAVYRAIPAAARAAMHRQAATALLDAGSGATTAARHLLETHPGGDPWVVRQLRTASRDHLRTGAPNAARRCLARALREPPATEDRAALLFELGCSALFNDPTATVNHLTRALDEPAIDPALREAVTCRLAQALAHTNRLPEAAQLVASAARRANSADSRLRMQAEHLLWGGLHADSKNAHLRSRRLARLAERLTGRSRAEQQILGLRAADAVMRSESAATALHYADKALSPGLTWAHEDFGFEVPTIVALLYMNCDQPDRSAELFAQGMAEFERRGWRGTHLSLVHTLLGYVRFRCGRLHEAEALARTGLRLATRVTKGGPAERYAVGILTQILLARGQIEGAQALTEAHTDGGPPPPEASVLPDLQTAIGQLLLARGRARQAAALLSDAGRDLESRGMHNPSWCRWQLDLAQAQASHHPSQARAQAHQALARARAFGTPSAIGQALHTAAQITEGPQALDLLSDAIAHLERSPAAYDLACALTDHGTMLRRSGHLTRAATQLSRGMEVAAKCGADGLTDRARAELSEADKHSRGSRRTP